MTKGDLKTLQEYIDISFEKAIPSIQGAVEAQVKTTVNGQITALRTEFQSYRADDEKWKRENQPAIDNMKAFNITARLLIGLTVGIGGLAAFFANIGSIVGVFHH